MDCERIQTERNHACIRSMYLLLEDVVTDMYRELVPYVNRLIN